jgi:hypothetical protein
LPKWVRMNPQILRFLVRSAALAALALGLVVGSAGVAGAQLPELPPGEEDAPEETPEETPEEPAAPEDESPLPEELDPVLDPLQPVLDQLPGDEAPEEGGEPEDGTDTGDGSATPPPSSGPSGGSTLPRTGGEVALGFASLAAAGGLAVRRLLRV